ncbi:acyltransferase family protein [Leifsonia sp. NPDC058292]|uniref:acyltransferase family protein n=1 Tax=Leifsonia sp. NPDC058292 TaxID=3346428 RepID=UPI0036DF165A
MTLQRVFDPKLNTLNALRLLLAISVIVWHSFPLTGAPHTAHPVTQLLGEGGVDGFFAISGFLIVSSWMRRPKWWPYLQARFLRIVPAFWVCLIVTAAVIAPIGVLLSGAGFPADFVGEAMRYVGGNAGLRVVQFGIAGTPAGVPYPDVWNGSLWTLWWEFLCYLAVLGLGLTRLLRFRATIPVIFLLCLAVVVATGAGAVDNFYLVNAARFGLMFFAGALVHQLQHRLPARWWLVGVAAVIIVAAAFLPDYRVLAAIPLAYLLIVAGALLKVRRLRLQNDISYGTYIYAFPLQQVLASAGLYALGVPLFAVLATVFTLAIATASWYAIEKPALRLKGASVFRMRRHAPAVVERNPA